MIEGLSGQFTLRYAIGRQITGTPSFILDGFLLSGTDSAWGLEEWRKQIDPLVRGLMRASSGAEEEQ